VCVEREIYTIPLPDGGRDLRLEHGLDGLEDSFVRIRKDFIEPRKRLPAVPHVKLVAFVVAMQWRTPAARKHIQDQWEPVLALGNEMIESLRRMTPEERQAAAKVSLPSSGPAMGMDRVKMIVEQPLQTTLPSHLRVITPKLAQMKATVLCAAGAARFITSDNPCAWFDPEAYKRPPMYRGVGLMYDSIEVTMPISPTRCLLISHRHDLWDYVDVEDEVVHRTNARTRAYATAKFIAQGPTSDTRWYEVGCPPE